MSKTFSGKKIVKTLINKFAFYKVSQKGSHVKLRKEKEGKIITVIIPLHKELARGTVKAVLEQAHIEEKTFKHYVK